MGIIGIRFDFREPWKSYKESYEFRENQGQEVVRRSTV